jgi:hypothetical protein
MNFRAEAKFILCFLCLFAATYLYLLLPRYSVVLINSNTSVNRLITPSNVLPERSN